MKRAKNLPPCLNNKKQQQKIPTFFPNRFFALPSDIFDR